MLRAASQRSLARSVRLAFQISTTNSSRSRISLPLRFRQFSSESLLLPASKLAAAAPNKQPKAPRWKTIARFIRYTRIPLLVISVYQLGYQQGIIDDSRNPEQTRASLMDDVLAGVGATRDQVHVVKEEEEQGGVVYNLWSSSTSLGATTTNQQTQRVVKIARRIVQVSKRHVKMKLQEVAQRKRTQLPDDISHQDFLQALLADEEFQHWSQAMRRLEGDWSYILIDTALPNAFVTEILPHRIFITTAMLSPELIANDDELALVLGHEVSHLILGHLSEQNMLQTMLRTVEVLLLSMDPTEGLLGIAVVGFLATLRTALSAAHSREHEREADELGIQLAAMACFDTKRAAVVFSKLHEKEGGARNQPHEPHLLRFADSHPPSQERYEQLLLASETENSTKYQDDCEQVKSRLQDILKR